MQVAEVFTGSPGKYVDLANTISGFTGILSGKYDDLPEMAFYMVGDSRVMPFLSANSPLQLLDPACWPPGG